MANNCQVPTPPQYVNELLDYIGYSVNLHNKSVLENSCGEGNILKEIVRRYIKSSLEDGYSNEQIIHGLERHITGYDIDPVCVKKCIETLDVLGQEYGLRNVHWNVFEGLSEIIDKAVISNGIKNFLSSHLKYEIYDFSYTTSEYEALKDKKFQMLVVEDTPEYIPFLSKKESGSLKQNMIYIRRGTSCEIANEEELQIIFNRRMNYLHPLSGEPLQLEEHLKQLKILYEKIEKNHIYYKNGLSEGMTSFLSSVANLITKGEKIVEPNRKKLNSRLKMQD